MFLGSLLGLLGADGGLCDLRYLLESILAVSISTVSHRFLNVSICF
jgi:hypothetical protein